jgi:phage terminase large subunit GpA-like protein
MVDSDTPDQPIFIEGETGADQSQRLGLLPCPFCAGPPALFCEEKTFTFNGRSDTYWDCHVFCHECGATAENSHLAWDLDIDASKDDSARYAIKAWQQRDRRNSHMYPILSEKN